MNLENGKLHLFDAYGMELEYMIVNRETFDVMPIADWLLSQVGPMGAREVDRGALWWSNELAMHVIELKGAGPVADMASLRYPFVENVRQINDLLSVKNGCLMGSAVHPWMNPDRDTALWALEDAPIYEALDRTFGCQGHGWFNLQSAHLNLPFANDGEFARLHAAIRLVLPIIPALAAASPFLDGKDSGFSDARLQVYSQHCNRLPEAIGDVIPEPVESREQYHDVILAPLYRALKQREPEGVLQYEWSNARGAIARFDRDAIEIRLIDVQEHPGMDAGVMGAVAAAVRLLAEQAEDDLAAMNAVSTQTLRRILNRAMAHGEHFFIRDSEYLHLLAGKREPFSGLRLWREILARCDDFYGAERQAAEWIIDNGTLATRMRRTTGEVTVASLKALAQQLCHSLAAGEALTGMRT